MRRILLLFLILFLSSVFVDAQSTRIQNFASRLSKQADELGERAYTEFSTRETNNRAELENLMLAQQVKAMADTFRRMVQDKRSDAELGEAAALLFETSRRFPNSGNYLWKDTGRLIDDVARELKVIDEDSPKPLARNSEIKPNN